MSQRLQSQTTIKKTVALDALRRGATVAEAAKAARCSRRTVYTWAESDPEFAALKDDAKANRSRRITEGQLSDWRAEERDLKAQVVEFERDLVEVAAPALGGDEAAQARQSALRKQLAAAREQLGGLAVAIESAELHIQRARQAEAEAARAAAAAEADDLAAQQRAAAERIDAALAEIESAWSDFATIAQQRQAVARKAGQFTRAAYDRVLVSAVFATAPSTATALGLDRRFRASARPLKDVVQ